MSRRVMVIAVHPDDETLGCGGTLLRHISEGDEVVWGVVTKASTAAGFGGDYVAKRERDMSSVAAMYGFAETVEFGFPPTQVDRIPLGELVAEFSKELARVRPAVLYLPFFGDVHSDHRQTFDAFQSCTKSFRAPYLDEVMMMETLSETEFANPASTSHFVPNVFVDISGHLERKLEILEVFSEELGPHPFPRSIEAVRALALLRGSQSACVSAESFMLLKKIRR